MSKGNIGDRKIPAINIRCVIREITNHFGSRSSAPTDATERSRKLIVGETIFSATPLSFLRPGHHAKSFDTGFFYLSNGLHYRAITNILVRAQINLFVRIDFLYGSE